MKIQTTPVAQVIIGLNNCRRGAYSCATGIVIVGIDYPIMTKAPPENKIQIQYWQHCLVQNNTEFLTPTGDQWKNEKFTPVNVTINHDGP